MSGSEIGTPYTSGVWRVRHGRADEFVKAWVELAGWTAASVPGAGRAILLRDATDPDRFVSFGPWESEAAIAAWRALPGWQERVGRIRELLEGFEPSTLVLAAASD